MHYSQMAFSELKGKTLVHITESEDKLVFVDSEGQEYSMHHEQDCCEHVYIESIVGDLRDLVGNPILLAEEAMSEEPFEGKFGHESFTWTFYKLATRKGYADIRWLGESNGYYSESVGLYKTRILESKELVKLNGKKKKVSNYKL